MWPPSPMPSRPKASRRRGRRSGRSSAATRPRSMKRTSAAPPSKASPRITPTASSRRSSGCVVGGLPGAGCYKAINTADSMIGHKNERYLAFGWARGAPRRSRQLAGVATGGTVHRRCRGAAARARCAGGVARRRPRRAAPPLAQCRLAGSGDGGRARAAARRPARLWRRSPSTTIGWATGTAEAGPADIRARAAALSHRLPAAGAGRCGARGGVRYLKRGVRAVASSASQSRWRSRCAASASSVASTTSS